MDPTALQQFRAVLERRRFELLMPLTRVQEEARALAERSADAGEQSAQTMSREFLFTQADATRRLLRAIEEALIRIREGQFGACDHCGGEIPLMRLKAIPWVRTCVACQEMLEGERQRTVA